MNFKPIIWSLVGAAAFLAFAWGLRSAEGAGLVSGELTKRTVQVIIGLGLAVYGNFMPKIIDQVSPTLRAAKLRQTVMRIGGWSMTLAGVIYAGLWAFAPLGFARPASMAAVLAAVAIMLGYMVWAIAACRRARPTAT